MCSLCNILALFISYPALIITIVIQTYIDSVYVSITQCPYMKTFFFNSTIVHKCTFHKLMHQKCPLLLTLALQKKFFFVKFTSKIPFHFRLFLGHSVDLEQYFS